METDIKETQIRLNKFFIEEVNLFLEKTRLDNDAENALKNVSHAILWANALDEFYRKSFSLYESVKEKDEDSNIIDGIRYGRNRAVHQYTQLLYITNGAAFPATFPIPFFEIRWKPINELPLADKGHEHKRLQPFYIKYLENKPVRFTFVELKKYFERIDKIYRAD